MLLPKASRAEQQNVHLNGCWETLLSWKMVLGPGELHFGGLSLHLKNDVDKNFYNSNFFEDHINLFDQCILSFIYSD